MLMAGFGPGALSLNTGLIGMEKRLDRTMQTFPVPLRTFQNFTRFYRTCQNVFSSFKTFQTFEGFPQVFKSFETVCRLQVFSWLLRLFQDWMTLYLVWQLRFSVSRWAKCPVSQTRCSTPTMTKLEVLESFWTKRTTTSLCTCQGERHVSSPTKMFVFKEPQLHVWTTRLFVHSSLVVLDSSGLMTQDKKWNSFKHWDLICLCRDSDISSFTEGVSPRPKDYDTGAESGDDLDVEDFTVWVTP